MWKRFILDYLTSITDTNVLKAHAATEKGAKELAEVRTRPKLTEQLRFGEATQKQPLKEAFKKGKGKLLNEIVTLQKRTTRTEN